MHTARHRAAHHARQARSEENGVIGSTQPTLPQRHLILPWAETGGASAVAVVVAFAIAGPIVLGLGLSSRLIVFAVVIAFQLARRSSALRLGSIGVLAALPVLALLTLLLGAAIRDSRVLGDVLLVVAFTGSFALRRSATQSARLGRLLIVPVVMVFVTPVPVGGGSHDVLLYLGFSLIAGVSAIGAERLTARLVGPGALRAALTAFPAGLPRRSSHRRAAADLDARIVAMATTQTRELRRVLLETELAMTVAPARVAAARARLEDTAHTVRFELRRPTIAAAEAGVRVSRLRPSSTTRVALHAGIGLALALVIAQQLYPHRWSWAAVSVIAISGGLRSRGDVIVRGGERLLGALGGTLLATLTVATVTSSRAGAITLVLTLLVAGALLRESTYAVYAFCITSALAMLYGLYGERSSALLGQRLVENVIGAACVIVPSFFLLPIRTEDVVHRRVADLLAALSELLASLGAPPPPAELVESVRRVDRLEASLEEALRPLTIYGRIVRVLGREPHRAGELAERSLAEVAASRPIVYAALDPEHAVSAVELGTLRRQVGALRRELAATRR